MTFDGQKINFISQWLSKMDVHYFPKHSSSKNSSSKNSSRGQDSLSLHSIETSKSGIFPQNTYAVILTECISLLQHGQITGLFVFVAYITYWILCS